MCEPEPTHTRVERESSDIQFLEVVTLNKTPVIIPPRILSFPNVLRTNSPKEVIDLEDDLPPPALSFRASTARDVLLEQERITERESTVRSVRLSSVGSSDGSEDAESLCSLSRKSEEPVNNDRLTSTSEELDDADQDSIIVEDRGSQSPMAIEATDDDDDDVQILESENEEVEDGGTEHVDDDDTERRVETPEENDLEESSSVDSDVVENRGSEISEDTRARMEELFPEELVEEFDYGPTVQVYPDVESEYDEDDSVYEDNSDSDVMDIEEEERWEKIIGRFTRNNKSGQETAPKMKLTTRLELREDQDQIRPVLFRRQPTPEPEDKKKKKRKRTLPTAHLLGVRQYHKADSSTYFDEIPVAHLSETIEEYLNKGKPFMPPSQKVGDTMMCAAVEHENHIKMFHFGQVMKKSSCTQKQKKFQRYWWNLHEKKYRKDSALLPKAIYPRFDVRDDPYIFEQHYAAPKETKTHLQRILRRYRPLLNKNRSTDDCIRDSSYFVREFFLPKCNISVRITTTAELPECYVPPTLCCGYFPASAETVENRVHYLTERFLEAQVEYLNLTYRNIAPPRGFSSGAILSEELYKFHRRGRHLHGFFVVWEENEIDQGLKKRKRYLVDVFNLIRFPLYVDYIHWNIQLRVSFDKLCTYNLHLAESLRCNRPVFDVLAQSKTLFQPFTWNEMISSIKMNSKDPIEPSKYLSRKAYFESALRLSNQNFLSAFTMIIGGAKLLQTKKQLRLFAETHVFHQSTMDFRIINEKSNGSVSKIILKPLHLVHVTKPFGKDVEESRIRERPNEPIITRLICAIPKTEPPRPPPPPSKNRRNFMVALSRAKLIPVRAKIYGFEYPPRPPKVVKPPAPKKRGRKKKDPIEKYLRTHNFDTKLEASDIESNFEGYDSDREVMEYGDLMMPFLKRTTSSESIFLDYTYQEVLLNRLSSIHNQKVSRQPEMTSKRKWRKISRISKNQTVYREAYFADKEVLVKKNNCFHRVLPVTKKHAHETKMAMRNPINFTRFNIPRVFEKGEVPLVNDVFDCLSSVVNDVEAGEISNIRGKHKFVLFRQDSINERRRDLAVIKPGPSSKLPPPDFRCIEMLSGRKMVSREMVDVIKQHLADAIPTDPVAFKKETRQREIDEKQKQEAMLRAHVRHEADRIKKFQENAIAEADKNKTKNQLSYQKRAEKKQQENQQKSTRVQSETSRCQKQADEHKRRQDEKDREQERERQRERDKKLEEAEKARRDREFEEDQRQLELIRKLKKEKDEKEAKEKAARKEERLEEIRLEKEKKANQKRIDELLRKQEEEERKDQERAKRKKAEEEAAQKQFRIIAALIPDEETVYLHHVTADISLHKFLKARHDFRRTNHQEVMMRSHERWTKTFLSECGMQRSLLFETLIGMVDHNKKLIDSFYNLIFENLAKCFKYELIGPSEREWQFDFKEKYLNFDYVNRTLVGDDPDFLYNVTIPKDRSARQSLYRTHPGFFTTPVRNTPGDSRDMFALVYRSQKAYEREVNTTISVSFSKMNAQSASVVIPYSERVRVEKTIRIPLATSTPKPSAVRVENEVEKQEEEVFKTPKLIPKSGGIRKRLSGLSNPLAKRLWETTKTPEKKQHENKEAVSESREKKTPEKSISNTETSSKTPEEESKPERLCDQKPIWRLATYFGKENMSFKERMNVLDKLEKVLSKSVLPTDRKVCWSFGVLPILCHFATGMLANEITLSCRKTSNPIITHTKTNVKFVIEKLLETSLILAEASNSDKGAFREALHNNGFEFSMIAATKVLNAIGDILLNLDTHTLFIEAVNPKHIFCEVVKELSEELIKTLKMDDSLKEEEVDNLVKDIELTSNAILDKPHWESILRKSAKKDSERVFRVRSLYVWFSSMAEFGAGMTVAVDKLFNRMELKMAGIDWRAMERAQQSSEKEVDLNATTLTEMWADLSTIHEEPVIPDPIKSEEEKKLQFLKRKRAAEMEARLPSKLPKFDDNFENVVWRTIERTFNDLSGPEWDTIPAFKNYNRGHRKSKFRFHMLLNNTDCFNRVNKKKLIKLMVDNKDESRLNAEKNAISRVEHEIIVESMFKNMQWRVGSKSAIEFFTDLGKFKNQKDAFKQAISPNGFVKFNFKIYKHHWFMGNTKPVRCFPDSHEDTIDKACGGCTNGDVVLIHNCICEHFDESLDDGACHVAAISKPGQLMVARLVGRFVCKHGPNSTLVLETEPVGEILFKRKEAVYKNYTAYLRIVDENKMFTDLNQSLSGTVSSSINKNATECEKKNESEKVHPKKNKSMVSTRAREVLLPLKPEDKQKFVVLDFVGPVQEVSKKFSKQAPPPKPVSNVAPETEESDSPIIPSYVIEVGPLPPQEAFDNEIYDNHIRRVYEKNCNDPRAVRSKSAERGRKGRVNMFKGRGRCVSACNFAHLETYARQKIKYVVDSYNNANSHHDFHHGTVPLTPAHANKMTELSDLLNGWEGVDSDLSAKLFVSLMTSGELTDSSKEVCVDVVNRVKTEVPVVMYRGAPSISNNTQHYKGDVLTRGEHISPMMDEYYKFQQFKSDILSEANILTMGVQDLRSSETRKMTHLFESYKLLFKFNMSLFEHILEMIAKHMFNPYNVYKVDSDLKNREENVKKFKTQMKRVKSGMHVVKNALFNLEPLKRQCDELYTLQNRLGTNEVVKIAVSLAKCVVERIRAPSSAGDFPEQFNRWLNSSNSFTETIDLMVFSVSDFLPDEKLQNYFQRKAEKLGIFEESYDSLFKNISPSKPDFTMFYSLIFSQSYNFLDSLVTSGIKTKDVDPFMKAFYGFKTFRRMYELVKRKRILTSGDLIMAPQAMNAFVISTIIATPKLEFNIYQDACRINNYYDKLIKVETNGFFVEPSNIGTYCLVYGNNFIFSVVQEERVEVHRDYVFPYRSCIKDPEVSMDAVNEFGTITQIVDPTTRMLSFVFKTKGGRGGKNDRVDVEPLDQKLFYVENNITKVDFLKVFKIYIGSSYNNLRRILDFIEKSKNDTLIESEDGSIITPGSKIWIEKEELLEKPREQYVPPSDNLVQRVFDIEREDNELYVAPESSRLPRIDSRKRKIQ